MLNKQKLSHIFGETLENQLETIKKSVEENIKKELCTKTQNNNIPNSIH